MVRSRGSGPEPRIESRSLPTRASARDWQRSDTSRGKRAGRTGRRRRCGVSPVRLPRAGRATARVQLRIAGRRPGTRPLVFRGPGRWRGRRRGDGSCPRTSGHRGRGPGSCPPEGADPDAAESRAGARRSKPFSDRPAAEPSIFNTVESVGCCSRWRRCWPSPCVAIQRIPLRVVRLVQSPPARAAAAANLGRPSRDPRTFLRFRSGSSAERLSRPRWIRRTRGWTATPGRLGEDRAAKADDRDLAPLAMLCERLALRLAAATARGVVAWCYCAVPARTTRSSSNRRIPWARSA